MPTLDDYMRSLAENTRTAMGHVFPPVANQPTTFDPQNPPYPGILRLSEGESEHYAPDADTKPPDAPIEEVFRRYSARRFTDPADKIRLINVPEAEALASIPVAQRTFEESEDLRELTTQLREMVTSYGETGQWAHHYFKAAAVNFETNPGDAQTTNDFNRASEGSLFFFPTINGQITPVRYRFSERFGKWYGITKKGDEDGGSDDSGYFCPESDCELQWTDYAQTGLSREALARPLFALGAIHHARPTDPELVSRLQQPVDAILEVLKSSGYRTFVGPGSKVHFSAVARLLPRPSAVLVPLSRQIDALKGGDALLMYSILRVGAAINPTRWASEAAEYFREHRAAFRMTTISLFFELLQAREGDVASRVKLAVKSTLLGAAVGALLGLAVAGILGLAGLAFSFLAVPVVAAVGTGALIGAVAGGTVGLLAPIAVDPFRINIKTPLAVESDSLDILTLLDHDPEARALWNEKLYQIRALDARRRDALVNAYYARSDDGQAALQVNLVAARKLLAELRAARKRAKRRWRRRPLSLRRLRKYVVARTRYLVARAAYEWVWGVHYSVKVEVPHRLLWAHYGRAYSRNLKDYDPANPTTLGGVLNKVNHMNEHYFPMTVGDEGVGFHTLEDAALPGRFETVRTLLDLGGIRGPWVPGSKYQVVQLKDVPEPQYMASGESGPFNTFVYRFEREGGQVFHGTPVGQALLAYGILRNLEKRLGKKLLP